MTNYKSVLAMLVSPPKPKVVAAVNGVITSALGGMLFNFLLFSTVTLVVNI